MGQRHHNSNTIRGVLDAARSVFALHGAVAFDGTSSQKIIAPLGINMGTQAFSLSKMVKIPAINPTTNYGLGFVGGTTGNVGQDNCLHYHITTAGELRLFYRLETAANNTASAYVTNVVSRFGGKEVHLAIVRNASGNPSVYINGVLQTLSSVTFQGTGTWQSAMNTTYWHFGYITSAEAYIGTMRRATFFNFALSAANVQEIYELGGALPEWAKTQWGSETAKYSSNFTSGADGWGADNGTIVGNTDQDADSAGVPPSNDWAKFTRTAGGSGTCYAYSNGFSNYYSPWRALIGSRFRVTFDIFVPSGSTAVYAFLDMFQGAPNAPLYSAITPGSVTSLSFEVTCTENITPRMTIGISASGSSTTSFANGTAFYIKNVKVYTLGALAHYPMNEGIGYQLHDVSVNALDAMMATSGITHTVRQSRGYVRGAVTWAGTHEFKSLTGQDCLPVGAVLDLAVIKATAGSSGTGILFGTASDNGRFSAAAVVFTTAKKVLDLYTRLMASGASLGSGHLNLGFDPDNANYTGTITAEIHYYETQQAA